MNSAFKPSDSSLFFSKNDPEDPRLGQWVQSKPLKDKGFVLAGYPDDEGIQLNGGRIGASQGPKEIRRNLYKMTFPKNPQLFDLGDLKVSGPLEQRHKQVKKTASEHLSQGHRWIGLGGGHDYGYPDGAAFLSHYPQGVILNFDAHLDVRPTDHGFHSGTPFRRLLEEFDAFSLAEVGVQRQCNSSHHRQWCESKGAKVIDWEDIQTSNLNLTTLIQEKLGSWLNPNSPAFISIDIDAFSSSYAMGCSQSWPTGFEPNTFIPLLDFLIKNFDVRCLSVYEVSPPLDVDNRTSKLAALLIERFLK